MLLIVFRNNLSFFFHPKRAADPAMLGVGYIVSPLIAHSWSGSRSTGVDGWNGEPLEERKSRGGRSVS